VSDPIAINRALSEAVDRLRFADPVAYVYNPLRYARRPGETFLRRFARRGCDALFLGMNPGPFGMVQTGVPFGEVTMVRDWMGIEGPVGRPPREHPKRPVQGFACARSEVSGARFWGWARDRFGTPERFAERFLVWNYCPLVFLEEGGRNRTPDKLRAEERRALFLPCDDALRRLVRWLEPRMVVGIGAFATARARASLADAGVPTGSILHPSPASPLANRGWAPRAEAQLAAMGLLSAPSPRAARATRRKA